MISTFLTPLGPDHRNSDRVMTQLEYPELHLDGGAQGQLSVKLTTQGRVRDQEVKALGGSPNVRHGTWKDAGPRNQLGEKEAMDVLNVRSHRTSKQLESKIESSLGWELEVGDKSFQGDSLL